MPAGEFETGILDGGADALPGLLDGGVGQADDLEGGQTVGDIAFDLHLVAVDAAQAQGMYVADHGAPPLPESVQNFTYIS